MIWCNRGNTWVISWSVIAFRALSCSYEELTTCCQVQASIRDRFRQLESGLHFRNWPIAELYVVKTYTWFTSAFRSEAELRFPDLWLPRSTQLGTFWIPRWYSVNGQKRSLRKTSNGDIQHFFWYYLYKRLCLMAAADTKKSAFVILQWTQTP